VRRTIPSDERGLRDRAIFELGLMTLRISSALKLDLDDLNELDRRLVRVKLKGGDQATQRITEMAAKAIRAWLERRPACGSVAVFVPLPPRKGPCRLEYTTVEKALRRYLKAAGITRRVRFHDLRHTAGLRLANRGGPSPNHPGYHPPQGPQDDPDLHGSRLGGDRRGRRSRAPIPRVKVIYTGLRQGEVAL
jgi:site-specific recombinase XerD